MVLESDLVSFFYKCWPVFPAPLVKEIIFNPLYILDSFVKDKVSIGVWIYLWAFYFCSTDLYFSLCASTILLWVCLFSRASSQGGWFLLFHSSFSRLLWLFEVFLYFHTNCEIIYSSSVKNTSCHSRADKKVGHENEVLGYQAFHLLLGCSLCANASHTMKMAK